MMSNLTVLKIGGSFINQQNLKELKIIIKAIKNINKHKLIIVTGGGKAADFVRGYDNKVQLKASSSHFAAVAAMELNSYLISDFFDDFSFFSTDFIFSKKINIFLGLDYYREIDPPPHSWNVSSDSIALELSQRLKADNLFLIKQRTMKNNLEIKIQSAADNKLIDSYFPKLYQELDGKLKTLIINTKSIKNLKMLIEKSEAEISNKAFDLKRENFNLNILE